MHLFIYVYIYVYIMKKKISNFQARSSLLKISKAFFRYLNKHYVIIFITFIKLSFKGIDLKILLIFYECFKKKILFFN